MDARDKRGSSNSPNPFLLSSQSPSREEPESKKEGSDVRDNEETSQPSKEKKSGKQGFFFLFERFYPAK